MTSMLSTMENDVLDVNVDEFIKAFTTAVDDSPARPPLGEKGSHYSNSTQGSLSPSQADHGFGSFSDLSSASYTAEWLNDFGLEQTLHGGVNTPSSRGSSLDTPQLPQANFMSSIDPSRLKEVPSLGVGSFSDNEGSDFWGLSDRAFSSQPQSTPQNSNSASDQLSSFTTNIATPHLRSNSLITPSKNTRKYADVCGDSPPSTIKRRRMGSLPEIIIPANPTPRTLQRSVSSGPIVQASDLTELGFAPLSPLSAGPLSAPLAAPLAEQTFYTGPITAGQVGNNVPRPFTHSHNHNSLATIPEAPSSAPPDGQWTMGSVMQQPPQNQAPGVRIATHPSMTGFSIPPTPQFGTESLQVNSMPIPSAHRFSPILTCPPVPPSLPTQRPLSAGSTRGYAGKQRRTMPVSHNSTSSLGQIGMGRPQPPHMRRSSDTDAVFGSQTHVGAMLRSTSVPQGPGMPSSHNVSAAAYGPTGGLPPPPPSHVTTPTFHQPPPGVPFSHLGHGAPTWQMMQAQAQQQQHLIQHQQAPQVRIAPSLGLGPAPGSNSPPRKRVSSKRVGMFLKPGPKAKSKARSDDGSIASSSRSVSLASTASSCLSVDSAHTNANAHMPLIPVSYDEFCAAFTTTQRGTIIPTPALEAMTDRLMYATDEGTVEQCFKWCYTVGTEYNKAAEKQSKFFRCLFDECADSNTRTFMRKSAVDSHVRTHVGYRPFRCEVDPECDARFVRKHDRDRHVATTHKNEKSFLCTDCGQNFARSDALLRHRAKKDACKARIG